MDLCVKRFVQHGFTAGPHCLAQIADYYGVKLEANDVVAHTRMVYGSGTYDASIALAANHYGFDTQLYTYNLMALGADWFRLPPDLLLKRIEFKAADAEGKRKNSLEAYAQYLKHGGRLLFELSPEFAILNALKQKKPVIVGLCQNYLYALKAEQTDLGLGDPIGQFVVIDGFKKNEFHVVDPWPDIPFSKNGTYWVNASALTASILLGQATFDACILVLEPKTR